MTYAFPKNDPSNIQDNEEKLKLEDIAFELLNKL